MVVRLVIDINCVEVHGNVIVNEVFAGKIKLLVGVFHANHVTVDFFEVLTLVSHGESQAELIGFVANCQVAHGIRLVRQAGFVALAVE